MKRQHAAMSEVGPARVSCVGLISPCLVTRVETHPRDNEHSYYRDAFWQIGTDAGIVAATLAHWGVAATLVANALGRDALGREFVRTLRAHGVQGDLRLRDDIATPIEVIVADSRDVRVWYTPEASEVWNTIADASLASIEASSYVYSDWYALEGAGSAVRTASKAAVPALLNLGRTAWRADSMPPYGGLAAALQASCDDRDDADVAEAMLADLRARVDVPTIVVTHGRKGCLASVANVSYRVSAPRAAVVDTNGAGATFSAAFILARLKRWDVLEQLRFACTAASLKCEAPGIIKHSVAEVQAVMTNGAHRWEQ